MPLLPSDYQEDRLFNNADSFAMTFDKIWKENLNVNSRISTKKRLEIVMEQIKDHPFMKSSPEDAIKIADFRIRLLKFD